MELFGYIASLLIGISLGLIGGGGSILTVPVMVYLFGLQPVLATSYSLFIVGSTSLIGAYENFKKGLVNIKAALLFAVSSIVSVFVTRKFILPSIPTEIATIGGFTITASFATMVLFGLLMLLASVNMIRGSKANVAEKECTKCMRIGKLALYGTGIGLITGLLGAGGGFLLIPALVVLLKLPMKKAVGTSLLIIALNSLTGFTGDLGHFSIDWFFLMKITAIAVAGIYIGNALSGKIAAQSLRRGFGWFVLLMAILIIVLEIA